MNRPRIVSTAHVVLIALVGFALVYGLPLLGLNFAIDHGLYVASAAAVLPSVPVIGPRSGVWFPDSSRVTLLTVSLLSPVAAAIALIDRPDSRSDAMP